MKIASLSNRGMERERNEDNCFIKANSDIALMMVADGMGGHQAGNVASELAVSTAEKFWNNIDFNNELTAEKSRDFITNLIQDANEQIYNEANKSSIKRGMGTTITAGLLNDTHLTIGHIGDSRAYLVNTDRIKLLTKDHSLIEQLLESGQIKADEADNHPQRHILTRAVGITEEPEIDLDEFDLEKGSILLLCTDGLTTLVRDLEIWSECQEHKDPQELTKSLINLANSRGGYDNITVVAVTDIGGHQE